MAGGTNVTGYLEAAMRASSLRARVIASNLANIQTPGYRRRVVEFERLLAEAMDSSSRHGLEDLKAQIRQPMTNPVDANNNDVVLEQEIGELLKNSARYRIYSRLLAKAYRKMELAMSDRLTP